MLAEFMRQAPQLGDLGRYVKRSFSAFDFTGVDTPYREYGGDSSEADVVQLFALMADLKKNLRGISP